MLNQLAGFEKIFCGGGEREIYNGCVSQGHSKGGALGAKAYTFNLYVHVYIYI